MTIIITLFLIFTAQRQNKANHDLNRALTDSSFWERHANVYKKRLSR